MTTSRGSYVLLLSLDAPKEISIGALGRTEVAPGAYVYAGSALGPGGFSRLERHRSVAAGESTTRHWHIDYLLGDPHMKLQDVIRFPDRDIECRLAQEIGETVVPGFGASDCSCDSHLSFAAELATLRRSAHRLESSLEE